MDLGPYTFNPKPKNYLMFLGRTSPEKGIVPAIKIAKTARLPLVIAAKIDAVDHKYYQEKVKHLVDGKQIKYLGEVNLARKVYYLRNALALLFPIQWQEPFGLVMIEAMACGTPVIASRLGSVPEVIAHGKTGFVINPEIPQLIHEGATAVEKIATISRRACREHVENNFTADIMVENYLKLYRKFV
jgi:glycosyltransferase involved in cell wall biosynthesis